MKFGLRYAPPAFAAAGAVVCAALALPSVAKADAECDADRVTGISAVLDAVSTGSAAGPSVLFGVATVPLSQPLPAPLDAAQAQLLATGAENVQQMRADAPGQVDQVRTAVAPLASGNEMANQGVEAFASALEGGADAGGAAIAPGDTSLRETATIVRASREDAPAC